MSDLKKILPHRLLATDQERSSIRNWLERGRPVQSVAMLVMATLLLGGCIFKEVKEQQQKLESFCTIQGSIRAEKSGKHPLVVALVRIKPVDTQGREAWELADHFVLESAGRWVFRTVPGSYGLAAFEDRNANLVYDPGEPGLRVSPSTSFVCTPNQRLTDIRLVVPARERLAVDGPIDLARLQARSISDQLNASLGAVTAFGEVTTLDDPRFGKKHTEQGLWKPFDFLFDAHPGIYFLEPYNPKKTPVLFVHGMLGTPTDFRTLIGKLDRERFQPWVFYYPTGVHLPAVADYLDQTVKRLQLKHGFKRMLLVAHSMGGLVSRGFLLRNQTETRRLEIPLFISISTPWGGIKSAESGVKHAPTVVHVWYDIVPDSGYLRSIYYLDPEQKTRHRNLPTGTTHHLLFGFHRNSRTLGESDDHEVSVASQLHPNAQREAVRLYGFDATHEGILEKPEVAGLLNRLFTEQIQIKRSRTE